MSLVMLCSCDVFQLIDYFSLILWLSVAACILGLLYLRHSKPNMPRPIRVHLALPILFLICCLFLVSIPALERPVNAGEDIYRRSVYQMVDHWVCRLLVVVNRAKNSANANLKTMSMVCVVVFFFLLIEHVTHNTHIYGTVHIHLL
jgi:amino acid transporter